MGKNFEKIYRVFISATFEDLKDERQKVIKTLLDLDDYIPVTMEYFPASNDDQWTLIKKRLDKCDYYILIIAGRYGTINNDTEKSYTHMEYEYACKKKIPIISFVHKYPGKLEADKCEKDEKNRKKLEEFKKEIYKKMIKEWESSSELTNAIAPGLKELIRNFPRTGYITAREVERFEKVNKKLEEKVEELKEKIKKLEEENNKEKNEEVRIKKALKELENEYELKCNFREDKKKEDFKTSLTLKDIFLFLAFKLKESCNEKSIYEKIAEFIKNKIECDKKIYLVREEYIEILEKFEKIDLVEEESKKTRYGNDEKYWRLTALGKDVYIKLEDK